MTQGGRDHTSHRLVYYGLSETKAVQLLAIVASAIGATALAYNVLGQRPAHAIGVLVTFVLLVQFGSFLSDLEERSRRGVEGPEPSLWRAIVFEPRGFSRSSSTSCSLRLVPGCVPLAIGGLGSDFERSVYLSRVCRSCSRRDTSFFVALGVYRRVWRFATAGTPSRSQSGAIGSSGAAYLILIALRPIGSFPAVEIFVVDAILCTLLVGGIEAGAAPCCRKPAGAPAETPRSRRRAGRAGRSLVRELRESHEAHVVASGRQSSRTAAAHPRDQRRRQPGRDRPGDREHPCGRVLVTIPDAPQERLDVVVLGGTRPRG